MNVCMLSWEFPPRIVGGIARHCLGLSKSLVKEGHNVHVVTLDFPGTAPFEDVEGVKVHRVTLELGHPNFITWTYIFNHFLEKKLAVLNTDVRFDLIHIHDWLTASAGIASRYHLNIPLISTMHSTEMGRAQGLHSPDSYMIDGLEWWMTYEAKQIIVCSNAMKQRLIRHFHLPPAKIIVIPNAIDTSKYRREVHQTPIKRRWRIKPDERLVLFVGRLVPQKGVEYLIKAVPHIIRRHNKAKFIIVGDGWSRNQLEELAQSIDDNGRIQFLGFVSDSDVIELTMSADALVIPSIYEPFGIVALEGMAAGVPVIAANVDGLAEIIEHDRTGIHVYPKNPESIAWGVNQVLSDPKYGQRLIQNGKRRVEDVYSWDAVAGRTLEVYTKACKG